MFAVTIFSKLDCFNTADKLSQLHGFTVFCYTNSILSNFTTLMSLCI